YLGQNGSNGTPPATFGQTVQGITNGRTFRGYQPTLYTGYSGAAVANLNGYTQRPGYWGKTLTICPPDPRRPAAPTSDPHHPPNPFPTTLQGGRIRYYSAPPNYNDTALNTRWWAANLGTASTGALTDLNERFWKDYIDFVLGVQANGAGTYSNVQNGVPYSS